MFESDIVSLIYKKMDKLSIQKGFVELNFNEDIVNKLIPKNWLSSSSFKIQREKERFREKVLSSLYFLMSLTYIEYMENEYGKITYPKNKSLRSKLLFKEIEWVNEKENKMRIYLSRLICEDWAMENYKKSVFNESVELDI